MYVLLGLDTVLRITAAMAFLFVAVPAMMRPRPRELDRMQWFWWCLAAGVTLLTLLGQGLTLLNAYSTASLLLVIAVAVIVARARISNRTPAALLRDHYRAMVLVTLNTLEGRVNLRRRLRRVLRRRHTLPKASWTFAGWAVLVAIAAGFRLYRPFVTANLGPSDTYVHLYLMRLLEQGRQVDPAWGPYPRGMHFLLMAIHELTNADMILLMNFFGAIVGVLMTIAVADTARRLSRSTIAGLLAGLVFATMIGGMRQYFLLGARVATDNAAEGRSYMAMPYSAFPERAEFDVLLMAFQRQTATLPQELAIVFLFPAAMFLFSIKERWHLSGFLFCTAAIAAIHPGVAVPLVLLSAMTVLVTRTPWRDIRRATIAGALGILIGSTWMLAYIVYPRMGTEQEASGARSAITSYFPFIGRSDLARIVTWVAVTPFLIACAVIAVALLVRAFVTRRASLMWISLASLLFIGMHVASRFGLPEIVEVRRNAAWLAMALAILLGVAVAELLRTRALRPVAAVLLVLWLWRVPLTGAGEKLINYSGYSGTAQAVLEIERKLEPFTWTLVTYGQEFPMVLGKGFHLAAADFLERYDPARNMDIPTRYVFVAVEKTPHHFEINTWAARFSRADIQQRLQTWCFLYQIQHRNMRIFHDDKHVRVYVIDRGAQVGRL